MKIGFDAKRAYNNNSGLGNYSRFLISSIQKQMQETVYLFTPKVDSRFKSFVADAKLITPKGFFKKLGSFWRTFRISKEVKRLDLEIYHGLSNELPIGIETSGVKSVVTIHDLIFRRFPELYKSLDVKIYNRKFKDACIRADAVVAISEQTKQDIVKYYGTDTSKIKVVYQDCLPLFAAEIDFQGKQKVKQKYQLPDEYILCVGTIETRKNQLLILKAIVGNSNISVVLVGRETAYKAELMAYINEHKLNDRVKFLHQADFKDFPAIYQLAKLFVYPSIFEGFGIPVIEAQHSKVAVITSEGSCLSEAGGDGAYYINPYNVDDLREVIQELWVDENRRNQLIAKGTLNVERFRSEVIAQQYIDLYKELLGETT